MGEVWQLSYNMCGAQRFTVLLQILSEDAAGLSALGGVVQGNVSVDILQQNVHPSLPVPRQQTAEETEFLKKGKKNKNKFKLWPFIRLQLMIKWGPLSWLPRGVYLCRAMETLTDNAASELKNSLNNSPGVGLVQSEGIGYRYQPSLG